VSHFIDDIIQYPNSLIFDLKNDVFQKLDKKDMSCGEEDSLWMNNFKKEVIPKKYETQKTKECGIRKTRKVKREAEEDSDISDSEISAYLRNENEIKIIKKLRKRAAKMAKLD